MVTEGAVLPAHEDVEGPIRRNAAAARVRTAWALIGGHGRAAAAVTAAALVALTAWWTTGTPLAPATGLSVTMLLAAAVVDAVEHRLPNSLVAAAAVPPAAAAASTFLWTTRPIAGALAGALALGGPLLVAHLASPAGMGFGDVKAGVALGMALGLLEVRLTLVALASGAAATVLWSLASRRRVVPFGPGLVAGAVVALLVGRLWGLEVERWH